MECGLVVIYYQTKMAQDTSCAIFLFLVDK